MCKGAVIFTGNIRLLLRNMWILISFPGFDNKDEGKIYQQFSKIQNSNLSEINPLLNFIATETDKSVVHK